MDVNCSCDCLEDRAAERWERNAKTAYVKFHEAGKTMPQNV